MTHKKMLEEILKKMGFNPDQVMDVDEKEFDNILSSIPFLEDYWTMIDDLRMMQNYVKTMKYHVQTMEDVTVDVEKVMRKNKEWK